MSSVSRHTGIKIIYWNAVIASIVVGVALTSVLRRIHQHDTLIVRISEFYNVDPRLTASVIWQESRFDPTRTGQVGEVGLMQVTMAVAHEWAAMNGELDFKKPQLYNPETNVRAGVWYLSKALAYWSHTDDPVVYALAEYNAGRTNVRRWSSKATSKETFIKAITYPGTREYVERIAARYRGGV